MGTQQKQQCFKGVNKFMVLMWRLGMGGWVNSIPKLLGRILVMTHTGRKSGLLRRTPVNYAIQDGEIYCVAGFGVVSDWYRNLKANPQVEVWLPEGWWTGTAEDVSDMTGRLSVVRQILINSGVVAFIEGLNPYRASDEELTRLTADYRLVRIHRTAERTGKAGPGDLMMVWMYATHILFLLLLVILIFR
jgi:deazaflavin-dependent oxidoreductase (nitroreductase family)